MVQVDVFWSYAIGAGCGAAAAARQARHLTGTAVFLACGFAPSGIWLLWSFPDWETMHVAAGHADLPGWLVAAFALTNVTQGLLGYAVAQTLWQRGHRYLAWLQMPLGYLAMFFVLAYGWDGTGYRRFFAPTAAAWDGGQLDVSGFLGSDVALTLYAMAVVLVPALLWMQASWWGPGRWRTVALILVAVFGLGLGMAVAAAVVLSVAGVPIGTVVVAALLASVLHPRGPAGRLARAFPA
jgi:hypothetical protein